MTQQSFINAVAEEFELAFLSTGLRPARRNWGDGVNDGCMVTALDVGENGAAAPRSLLDELRLPGARVARVVRHLAARFPQFKKTWWKKFVAYGILAFDGFATHPVRWLKSTANRPLGRRESAKLFGAAVGGLVAQHVCSEAKQERSAITSPERREVLECVA